METTPRGSSDTHRFVPEIESAPATDIGVQPTQTGVKRRACSSQATSSTDRAREQEAKKRRRVHGTPQPGYVNQLSVRPSTRDKYLKALAKLDTFLLNVFRVKAEMQVAGAQLDLMIADYVNDLFWDGGALHEATMVWAAAAWRWNDFSKFGKVGAPATKQALAGFARMSPPKSRLPLPEPVFSWILEQLVASGRRRMAQAIYVGIAAYLRPGELMGLTCGQLVAPNAGGFTTAWTIVLHPRELNLPSKTGDYDDSIALDGLNQELLSALCLQLRSGRDPAEPLLRMTHQEFNGFSGRRS